MELPELSNLWNAPGNLFINRQLLKEVTLYKVKALLYSLKWSTYFELTLNIIFIFFLQGFISNYFNELRFLIPALILIVVTMVSTVFDIYKLYLFYSLRVDSPVAETQQKVAQLQYLEALEANSMMVIIPLFSAPILIVPAKAFFDFDLYQLGNWMPQYIIGSVVVGLVIAFLLRKLPNEKLKKAIDFLKEIKVD
ncbi:MAG: hypothetical protein R2804_01035 [Cyclobacteriaceae bacterium]|jgi:hypothetical protein